MKRWNLHTKLLILSLFALIALIMEVAVSLSSLAFIPTVPSLVFESAFSSLAPPPPTPIKSAAWNSSLYPATAVNLRKVDHKVAKSPETTPRQSSRHQRSVARTKKKEQHPQQPKHFQYHWSGINGTKSLVHFMRHYWDTNKFCDTVNQKRRERTEQDTVSMTIAMNCQELFYASGVGTGNFLTGIYGLRLAAQSLQVNLTMTCSDALSTRARFVLPWVMGYLPAPMQQRLLPLSEKACSTYNKAPIGHLVNDMQFEFRRMTVALVGIPPGRQDVRSWVLANLQTADSRGVGRGSRGSRDKDDKGNKYQIGVSMNPIQPLFPDVELDETVIHFRCGDLMDLNHLSYGFIQFSAYARHLSPTVKTIGILTQPFTSNRKGTNTTLFDSRPSDRASVTGKRCKIVISALADYLRQRFPSLQRVSIRSQESLAITYARIVMANESVGAMSSFPVFAMVASFGKAYLRKPEKPSQGPYQWVKWQPRVDKTLDNFHLFSEGNILRTTTVKAMWNEHKTAKVMLQWFLGENGQLSTSLPLASARLLQKHFT